MSKIYVLSYHEVQISGYRIFSNFEQALQEHLKHCIAETKSIMHSPEPSTEEADDELICDEDDTTSVLEVCELNKEGEYITTKEYDYEIFQSILEDVDDVETYIKELETQLQSGIPEDLLDLYS